VSTAAIAAVVAGHVVAFVLGMATGVVWVVKRRR
jgi:hypothetical protein